MYSVRVHCAKVRRTLHIMRSLEVKPMFTPSNSVYSFLFVAVTNCHKLNGLKQYKCIILQFCRLEVQQGSCWAKIKLSAGLNIFFSGSCRDSSFLEITSFCFFAFFMASFLQQWPVQSLHYISRSFLISPSASLSTFKKPSDYTGPTWIIWDSLPILRSSN